MLDKYLKMCENIEDKIEELNQLKIQRDELAQEIIELIEENRNDD